MNNFNLLDRYQEQIGIRVVPLPTRMELERVQLYPIGLLCEFVERLIALDVGLCLEVKYEAFTTSNISSMSQYARDKGFKLHCLRSAQKRILYVEKRS